MENESDVWQSKTWRMVYTICNEECEMEREIDLTVRAIGLELRSREQRIAKIELRSWAQQFLASKVLCDIGDWHIETTQV